MAEVVEEDYSVVVVVVGGDCVAVERRLRPIRVVAVAAGGQTGW